MRESDPQDPKGLIREAFRMEAVTEAECRSIFLDWALSLPPEADARAAIRALLDRHGAPRGHPMTQVLREGLEMPARTGRRGGHRARSQR
ncbi:hypothetical protein [Tranquillimonas alkanivorans]|uniref:Uncharacterized protein n=1 Tax=Tranquillimonas alkanivorans TaxID=441119 RepID=A0A1I5MM35_9RHOB|nr:hypothetical protein [Tranquillimonas alkanivorans]SFP09981.1 hypothetical protein SAMN04488047_102309 [Tranquillimonas alkanivorans]